MRSFTVEVHNPYKTFEYSTITAPRVGEDISDGVRVYTVKEVCHMLKSWTDGNGETTMLDYLLVRAE